MQTRSGNQSDTDNDVSFLITRRELADDTSLLSVEGDLDLASAPSLKWALADLQSAGSRHVVVDLARVSFIDSTALGVLIEARTKLENRRGFLLAAPGLETRRALEISGLDRHFAVHDSLGDALAVDV